MVQNIRFMTQTELGIFELSSVRETRPHRANSDQYSRYHVCNTTLQCENSAQLAVGRSARILNRKYGDSSERDQGSVEGICANI